MDRRSLTRYRGGRRQPHPQDLGVDTQIFAMLLASSGQQLLASVEDRYDSDDALALGTQLRRAHPPALVAAAIEQVELRRRAATKFGTDAAQMYFTRDGLEQATTSAVAGYRFGRLAEQVHTSVVDLCCGIGGDLLVASRHFGHVTGVDNDPLACAVARANLAALGCGGDVVEDDAGSHPLDRYAGVFLDPARRTESGRAWHRDGYRPGWEFVEQVLTRTGCVKTSPALPHDAVPSGVEAEWISVDGHVREICLWSPDLHSTDRRATLLDSAGATCSITSDDAVAEIGVQAVGRYVHEVDPAVSAAHLVAVAAARIDGWLVDDHIGYLSSNRPTTSPFVRSYEVLDELPYQRKQLKTALRQRNVGSLTIKKRGVDVDPTQLRRELALRGSAEATVVLTRTPDRARAYLVRRVPDVAESEHVSPP
jgi:hypothetical protein